MASKGLVTPLTPWPNSVLRAPFVEERQSLEERFRSAVSDRVPRRVQSLLPSPWFLIRHPAQVVATRSLLSLQIPRVPCLEGTGSGLEGTGSGLDKVYLRLGEQPPGREFVRIVKTPAITLSETAPPKKLSFFEAAKYTKATYGVCGFYRGALSSHLIDLSQSRVIEGCEQAICAALRSFWPADRTSRTGAPEHKEDEEEVSSSCIPTPIANSEVTFWRRSQNWCSSEDGQRSLTNILALALATGITYPLVMINFRQIAYEAYDGVSVGFLDMARLTILYDGDKSLFNGFRPYWCYKLLPSIAAYVATASVHGFSLNSKDSRAANQLPTDVKKLVERLLAPLLASSRHQQAKSEMPGLANSSPSINWLSNFSDPVGVILHLGHFEFQITIVEMLKLFAILGMGVQVSPKAHHMRNRFNRNA